MKHTKNHKTLKINQLGKMPLIINELCIIEKNISKNIRIYEKTFVPSGYKRLLITNKREGNSIKYQNVMNKLQFVHTKLNEMVEYHYDKKASTMEINIGLSYDLGNPNFEELINKLGISEINSVKVDFSDFDKWNKQLEELEFEPTSIKEIEELYQAIIKFEEKQNSNFNNMISDLPTKFQPIVKDSSKYGRTIYSNKSYLLK